MFSRLFLFTAVAAGTIAAAESPVAGTWQGKLEDVPAVVLTVKDDDGKLSGTITFYKIVNDGSGPRAEGKDTVALSDPVLDGKTLSFQVKNPRDEVRDFKMELTAENEASLKGGRMVRNGESSEAPPLKMVRDR